MYAKILLFLAFVTAATTQDKTGQVNTKDMSNLKRIVDFLNAEDDYYYDMYNDKLNALNSRWTKE